jgi:hypothetical protein
MQPRHWVYAIAISFVVLSATSATATTINSTTVSGSQLTIGGIGFNGALTVTLNGEKLIIVSRTSTQIIASMNIIPAPGSYRLTVKAGNNSTFAYVTVPAVPAILAQIALINQDDVIPQTTILNAPANGVYRVSYNALPLDDQCLQTYVVTATLDWVDDLRPRSVYSTAQLSGALYENSLLSWSVIFRAIAGTPISYEVPQVNCAPYDLFVTLEQLQ